MAGSLGELLVKIGIDASSLKTGLNATIKDLNKMEKTAVKSMGPAMDKIGAGLMVVGSAAAAGFGALLTSGIKANSNMEQYRATLETVMGDSEAAAKKLDWVKQFAAKTPFEIPELVESTVKLQAMGLEAEKMLPIAGDMAAVFASSGKTVGMATEAINDAMMGEFERLKEFGIKLKQTDFKEGGKYAGKTYAEAIVEEVKNHNYTGAADKLSQTFSGRLSTLKDTLMSALSTATGPLFDKIAVGMGNLITKIDELSANGTLQSWVNSATEGFNTFWAIGETVFNGLTWAGRFIIDNWGLIGPIVAGVLASYLAYSAAIPIIEGVKLAMLGWKTITTALAAEQGFLNAMMAANPIGLVVVAIGLLVAAGYALYQNWDTVKTMAINLWNTIKDNPLAWIVAGPIMALINAGISLYQNWDTVKAKAAELWAKVKELWALITDSPIANFVKNQLADLIRGVGEAVQVFKDVCTWISKAWNWLTTWNNTEAKKKTVEVDGVSGASVGNNAQGTDYWRGGYTWVGEEGPEILNIPRGSQIIPNDEIGKSVAKVSKQDASDKTGEGDIINNFADTFRGANFYVRSDNDIKQIAQELYRLGQNRTRGRAVMA
ncbi:MAG: hypothetical protein CVU43_17015 [Chloroflexi bacterium HGW-Chloroflexi-5]|jgi:hypothetical protein|nr:MAG: hypothetical protein CVU43_17015 [Chloroflexi bacterium HGW-Chloroflexi-5]